MPDNVTTNTPNASEKVFSTRQLIKFLLQLIRPYGRAFWLASLANLVMNIVSLYPAYAIAKIITFLATYSSGVSTKAMWTTLVFWIIAIIVRNAGFNLSKYYAFNVSEQAALDLHVQSVRHLCNLDISWHERENSGNKLKRINKGADGVDKILRLWVTSMLEIVVSYIGMVFVLQRFSNEIAIGIIFFILSYGFVSYRLTKRATAANDINLQYEERLSGQSYEAIANIRTVKVLSLQEPFMKRISDLAAETYQKIQRRIFLYQSASGFSMFYGNLLRFAMLIFILWGIVHGKYELGFFVLFWAYFNNIWEAAQDLTKISHEYSEAKYAIARVYHLLHEPVMIDDETNKIDFVDEWKKISFVDVSFAYGDNEVLRNISFEIKKGEKIGIVGLSGAGKSTLVKLLLKEHEGYTGDILFDYTSIREMKKRSYLRRVAVVLQDTEVFNFSLKENITIADADSKRDRRWLDRALTVSHVQDYVAKLPQGIETLIGEKGIKLSGGERQRLGIARAIYKNPEILFMDEATSHLDLESEEKIRDSLHEFFQDITAVVIAHRLTTIKEMDRILVIEGGKIIESGTFTQLRKKKGRFYDLWEKQNL